MTTTALLNQPVPAIGEPRSYFFNGRLLTAEDLQREQGLREGSQRRLARLLGCGVAQGMQVTALGGSSLRVTAGLGVTPSGEVLEIDTLELNLSAAARAGSGAGFGDCAAGIAAGLPLAGVHLLVLSPAWSPQGRAQTLLGEVGACNRRVEQPAVRARLLSLQVPAKASELTLRNLLAVGMLSPAEGLAPVAAGERLGWWPRQRQSSSLGANAPALAADDLPLAVMRLNSAAEVEFLDMDSARRRLAPPPSQAGDSMWPYSWGVELEAFAAQLLAQMQDPTLAASTAALKARAEEAFDWLPPVLVLTPAQLSRWRQVFKQTAVAPAKATVLPRESFVHALSGGLQASLVARPAAQVRLAQLQGHPERLLLRMRGEAAAEAAVEAGGDLFGRNEHTSAAVASIAGRILSEGRQGHGGGPSADEMRIAASALTQAPDRVPSKPPRSTGRPK